MLNLKKSWDKVISFKDKTWCKKLLCFIRLLFLSELRFYYYPTKCNLIGCVVPVSKGLFYALLYLYVYSYICLSVYFLATQPHITRWLRKGIFNHNWTKPRMQPRFTWYTMVYCITLVRRYYPITCVYSNHNASVPTLLKARFFIFF